MRKTAVNLLERKSMAYEIIKRDYIYRGKILDLSKTRFESATKGEVEIEIVHHNGGAGVLPVFKDRSVALVRQWRYPLSRYSLEICAGRIEPGQTPEMAALRELEEEVGLRAASLTELGQFNVAPGYCEERIFIYLAMGLAECAQRLDDDEEIEVVRMPFAEALDLVGSREIDDAKSIIAILMAAPLIEKM
ncbi:MAG TPA: NUDIX hydrolase [Blastocatellia bacterium]|nr:NUDIX hydrolase [Blastocatellia bacterium]